MVWRNHSQLFCWRDVDDVNITILLKFLNEVIADINVLCLLVKFRVVRRSYRALIFETNLNWSRPARPISDRKHCILTASLLQSDLVRCSQPLLFVLRWPKSFVYDLVASFDEGAICRLHIWTICRRDLLLRRQTRFSRRSFDVKKHDTEMQVSDNSQDDAKRVIVENRWNPIPNPNQFHRFV